MSAPVVVAVVSWNTRELLGECLRSLRADADSGVVEVWVVDNGSSDGSQRMVREEFPWVSLIERSDNPGFGAAVNDVARRTKSEWIAPANADVAVTPDSIRAMLRGRQEEESVGCVAPRLVTLGGSTQQSVHVFPPTNILTRTFPFERLSRRLGDRLCVEGAWDEHRPRRVDWADGAFLLVRRGAFDMVGGFDEEQWMYAEDLDLAWRLAEAGWVTRYEPGAVVSHAVSAATRRAFGPDRIRRQNVAMYVWMARRRGLVWARACAVAVVVAEAAKYLLLTPLRPALSPAWKRACHRARRRVMVHRAGLWRRERLLGGSTERR